MKRIRNRYNIPRRLLPLALCPDWENSEDTATDRLSRWAEYASL